MESFKTHYMRLDEMATELLKDLNREYIRKAMAIKSINIKAKEPTFLIKLILSAKNRNKNTEIKSLIKLALSPIIKLKMIIEPAKIIIDLLEYFFFKKKANTIKDKKW